MMFKWVAVPFILVPLCLAYSRSNYCPDGYCRHSSNCYLVVGLNVTYIDARAYCVLLGGNLLSITTESSKNAAVGVMKRSESEVFPGNYWLDSTDLLNPGDFKWMSTKNGLDFADWSNGYPLNQTSIENCVEMRRENYYHWSTSNCNEKKNFVCITAGTPSRQNNYYGYRQPGVSNDDTQDCLPIYDYNDDD